jgi:hypothetical protein
LRKPAHQLFANHEAENRVSQKLELLITQLSEITGFHRNPMRFVNVGAMRQGTDQ